MHLTGDALAQVAAEVILVAEVWEEANAATQRSRLGKEVGSALGGVPQGLASRGTRYSCQPFLCPRI